MAIKNKIMLVFVMFLLIISIVNSADTGFKSPSATGEDYNLWTSPTDAFSSNDVYATESTAGQEQDYYNFGFSIPAGATINGVEITVEGWCPGSIIIDGDKCDVKVDLSDNGGTTYGTKKTLTYNVDGGEITQTLGGATSGNAYWGLTLIDTDFSNANFRARIEMDILTGGATEFDLDHIQAKVYYTVSDTCTYSSGNWNVNCYDNCTVSSTVNLAGNNLNIGGYGRFTVASNGKITNAGNIQYTGQSAVNRCSVYKYGEIS